MKLSKLLSLGLVVSTLITSLTLSASAITPSHQAPVVYSPEFPDAYIVTEVTPNRYTVIFLRMLLTSSFIYGSMRMG